MRSAAPFAALSLAVFDGVLDMLAGRYPSDEFAELRPRITWDRTRNWLTPRQGAKRIAILNGGTIPDRGLYGVFLAGDAPSRSASANSTKRWSSRASPARPSSSAHPPGASTKSPTTACWSPPRPASRARCRSGTATAPAAPWSSAGASARWCANCARCHEAPPSPSSSRITTSTRSRGKRLRYLADQELATTEVPDDRTIVIERVRDELGDWRVCVLTPFGSRIHAPWAMAAAARPKPQGFDVETMWTEDGFVLRFPESRCSTRASFVLMDPGRRPNL